MPSPYQLQLALCVVEIVSGVVRLAWLLWRVFAGLVAWVLVAPTAEPPSRARIFDDENEPLIDLDQHLACLHGTPSSQDSGESVGSCCRASGRWTPPRMAWWPTRGSSGSATRRAAFSTFASRLKRGIIEAQQRILARRAASAAQQRSLSLQQESERRSSYHRLPPALRTLAFETSKTWDLVSSPFGTRPAFRVGQVDAELLDEELLELLKNHAGEGLKLLGAHLKDDWGAEIGVALRAVLWKLSIWDHGASYGASLQGLKYVDARGEATATKDATRWQRALYGLITVGGRYAWTRWEERLSSLENGYDEPSTLIQRLSRLTTTATNTHNIAAFFSFLIFLYNGKYRTLTDRILRLRLVPSSNQTNREVSFEYLNRQLVWHAFTEFLLFLLPLVGISRWRRLLARAWKKTTQTVSRLRAGTSTLEDDDDTQKGELGFLPERTCAICYQDQNPAGGQSEQDVMSAGANSGIVGSAATDITNPYEAIPCGCVYCFVCLASRIEAEEGEGFTCLRCGEPAVKACKPWNGDVLEPVRARSSDASEHGKASSRKSVAFADELEDEKARHERDEEDDEPLLSVDPMPLDDLDDSADWSRVNESYGAT